MAEYLYRNHGDWLDIESCTSKVLRVMKSPKESQEDFDGGGGGDKGLRLLWRTEPQSGF